MRTVASTYLKSAFDTCIAEGCSPAALLSVLPDGAAGFDDLLGRIPVAAMQDMLYAAEHELGWTGIGLKVGQNFRPTTFLDFGYALMSCSTLREVMTFNRNYQAVNQQLGRAKLEVEGPAAFVRWETPDTPDRARAATEMVFAGYIGIGKWITWTHGDEVRSMRFRHARPAHAGLVDEIFDCPIMYDEPVDALEFDADLVDKPLPAANPELVARLSRRLDLVLRSISEPGAVSLATYRIIERNLSNGVPTIGSVAEQMRMSDRTLRRKLSAENESFSNILTSVRRDVCEIYLNEPNRSMAEISELLGYSEQSAFTRAFRNWFGVTPTQYQRS